MKFIDEVVVFCRSGRGGNGCVSFRREKYVPRGGPNGGDGGDGGSVVLVADSSKTNLYHLIFKPHLLAKSGQHGSGKDKHGKNGGDLLVSVPPGTFIKDSKTGEMLCDLVEYGQRFVAARGGQGGRGNARFATSKNRAPRIAQEGEPGVERWIRLELKVLADVGLIGFPSVGKSSLLKKISSANPKIATYAFTTLSPNLGAVSIEEDFSFVVADLPGLIQGASEGLGLGFRFLRHAERTKILAYVLDLDPDADPPPEKAFRILREELSGYNETFKERPAMAIANKIDRKGAREVFRKIEKSFSTFGLKILPTSAHTGEGIDEMIREMARMVRSLSGRKPSEDAEEP